MKQANIVITKDTSNNIVINCDEKSMTIEQTNKEISASKLYDLIEYSKDKEYILDNLSDDIKNDDYIKCVHKILEDISKSINDINRLYSE